MSYYNAPVTIVSGPVVLVRLVLVLHHVNLLNLQ